MLYGLYLLQIMVLVGVAFEDCHRISMTECLAEDCHSDLLVHMQHLLVAAASTPMDLSVVMLALWVVLDREKRV